MPRKRLPPRLVARHGKAPGWIIRDGAIERRTGHGLDDRASAEKALAEYIASKHEPVTGESDLQRVPIADCLARYLAEHAPTVAKPEWLGHMATPLILWWGDRKLSDIRGQTCRAYAEHRTQVVSTQTVRHELRTLSAAINYYHREHGPLSAVPAVTLPPAPPPRERWLTRSEAARMLRASRRLGHAHVARLILIGLRTGTRSGAILALRWLPSTTGGHFDLDNRILHRSALGEVATNKRKPLCTIPDRLMPWLRRWRDQDIASGVSHVITFEGQPVKKLRRSWASVRAEAGLDAKATPHILRHTCVTWMLQAGISTWEVAGFVGMSEDTVRQVYGHHCPDHQVAARRMR